MENHTVPQESIDTLLKHMSMLFTAVTQIRTVQCSMDQTQMDTLITSIQGIAPVPKAPPVYARNPVQLDANPIVDYGSSVVAKRYRYTAAALSLTEFDHTTSKVLDIMTSLSERSDKSGWGSVTVSIT